MLFRVEIFDTFFSLLKLLVRLLIVLPVILFIVGFKTNTLIFKKIAIKLIVVGIFLSLILTIMYYMK